MSAWLPIVPYADRRDRLVAVLDRRAAFDDRVERAVRAILDDVRRRGDAALGDLSERLDGVRPEALAVPAEALDQALDALDLDLRETLEAAAANVRRFHRAEMPQSWEIDDGDGVRLGQRIVPVERAGLYVPAGTAPLPSSVIMNAVPAQVAGVRELHLCSPPGRDGRPHPLVLATARLLGIEHVYAVGGAQAVAALAFGTESVPCVDVVVGPGNAYVATAKKLVVGHVGIDSIAGPSEVVVLADAEADPTVAAADLLAQAEHDARASAVLVTPSHALAEAVQTEVERLVPTLSRADVLRASLPAYGAAVVTETMDEAVACVDELAPEHLVILSDAADALWKRVRHAGAVFLGYDSPEPVGDYFAGPNHVLPTGGTARFASALGVGVFLRRQSVVRYSAARLRRSGESIARFAEAEGFDAHALAVRVRLDGYGVRGTGSAEQVGTFLRPSDPSQPEHPSLLRTESLVPSTSYRVPMPAPVHLVRPEVRAQRVYRVPTTVEAAAKVDQNESPYDLPDDLKRAALAAFAETPWNRYPDDRPHRLVAALADRVGVPEDAVIVGRGSNELTYTVALCFLERGTPVVLPSPMFALYTSAFRMHGAHVVDVPAGDDLRHNPDAILEAARQSDAPLTVVTTPNNPTGQTIARADLERLAQGVPGVLLVDEAYHEFLDGPTATDLLKDHDNVLVMRTFSKAFGLAGIRLGYLVGAPALIREMEKARLPFLVGRLGEEVGLQVLRRPERVAERVAELKAERESLEDWLDALDGVEVVRGAANFFLFRTPLAAADLHRRMAERGVLIRNVTGYAALAPRDGLPGWVRASVGAPGENQTFRAALGSVMGEE